MINDAQEFRRDFPLLAQNMNGKPIVYLDNGATTQKPESMIHAVCGYYGGCNANPHRGAYALSVEATDIYENARERVRKFINAKKSNEIIFTKNATEALNLIAYSYGLSNIKEGDEIVITISEHHSNLVPWQHVAHAKGAVLKYIYLEEDGNLSEEDIQTKITEKTKLVAVTQVSNVLGLVNPVKEVADKAHSVGAVVVVDGSQSVAHMAVDVQAIDADFFAFSGHKMLSPMGIGVLYGKEKLLDAMPPFLMGGDMIEYVEEQEYASRVMFIIRRDELYRIKEQDERTSAVTQSLLRCYGGLFADYVNIDESLIAHSIGYTSDDVYHILAALSRQGIIHYIPRKRTPLLSYTANRTETERMKIP